MTEKNEKQLNDQEIEQIVGGGEGGGMTVSWARLVCPACHGTVVPGRSRNLFNWSESDKYQCRECHKVWKKKQLVEEQ